MTLLEAVSACLCKYATVSGRARRSEHWLSSLAFFLALMAWGILISITRWDILNFLATVFFLACLLPLLAVTVRRQRDIRRSGWWLLAASRYSDAYVKVLDNTTPPDQSVRPCS